MKHLMFFSVILATLTAPLNCTHSPYEHLKEEPRNGALAVWIDDFAHKNNKLSQEDEDKEDWKNNASLQQVINIAAAARKIQAEEHAQAKQQSLKDKLQEITKDNPVHSYLKIAEATLSNSSTMAAYERATEMPLSMHYSNPSILADDLKKHKETTQTNMQTLESAITEHQESYNRIHWYAGVPENGLLGALFGSAYHYCSKPFFNSSSSNSPESGLGKCVFTGLTIFASCKIISNLLERAKHTSTMTKCTEQIEDLRKHQTNTENFETRINVTEALINTKIKDLE